MLPYFVEKVNYLAYKNYQTVQKNIWRLFDRQGKSMFPAV